MNTFQEQWDQRSKPEEEELQNLRETYPNKKQKIIIDSSSNELKVSQEKAGQLFKRQEYILQQMR